LLRRGLSLGKPQAFSPPKFFGKFLFGFGVKGLLKLLEMGGALPFKYNGGGSPRGSKGDQGASQGLLFKTGLLRMSFGPDPEPSPGGGKGGGKGLPWESSHLGLSCGIGGGGK